MDTSILEKVPGAARMPVPPVASDPDEKIPQHRWAEYIGVFSDTHWRRLIERKVIPAPERTTPRKLYYRRCVLEEFRDRTPEQCAAAWWRGLVIDAVATICDRRTAGTPSRASAVKRLERMGLTTAKAAEVADMTVEQVLASPLFRGTEVG